MLSFDQTYSMGCEVLFSFIWLFSCAVRVPGKVLEPYSLIRNPQLAAVYLFDGPDLDLISSGYISNTNVSATTGIYPGSLSSIAVDGQSLFIDGNALFEIPFDFSPRVHPLVTVGGSIRLPSNDFPESSYRFV